MNADEEKIKHATTVTIPVDGVDVTVHDDGSVLITPTKNSGAKGIYLSPAVVGCIIGGREIVRNRMRDERPNGE